MTELSPALKAELIERLAQILVATRRRRAAERTDPQGGTTVGVDVHRTDAELAREEYRG